MKERIPDPQRLHRTDLVYPELSYRVVGALYDVFKELGFGHLERVYQKAVATRLTELQIPFQEQVSAPMRFHGLPSSKHYLDFLIDEKLVLELKQSKKLFRAGIDQVNAYLHATELKLGLLATFAPHGVSCMRILNIHS